MVCDHVGKAFFPQITVMQIIGRIAFPIFAYCLVVGCLHTRDIRKYLLRLLIFAVIAQPVYVLNFYGGLHRLEYLNILFTLFFGAIGVYGLMDAQKRWWMPVICLAACLLLKLEYGTYGIFVIVAFYAFREYRVASAVVMTAILAYYFFSAPYVMTGGVNLGLQGFAILAVPFIYIKTSFNIKISKYFFYAFYPLHILAIYLIRLLLK